MAMAAKTGGPQAVAQFLEGVQINAMRQDQLAQQQSRDYRADEMHQAQLANLEADNQRQAQAQDMDKLRAALALIQQETERQGATANDPVQAENAIMQQAQSAAGLYGLAPDKLTGMVPNMSGPITGRKKKQAQEIYAQAEKHFGPEALANDSITLQTGEVFGDIKPSALRALFAAPAVDASGAPAKPYVEPPNQGVPTTERLALAAFAKERGKTPDQLSSQDLLAFNKSFKQSDDRPLASQTPTPTGLPPRTQARVNRLADMFRSDPAVRRTGIIAEGYAFTRSLNDNTNNPADDQALIYAFAKAMDPESVVREGEYATVQKYAQSWLQSFGFNAARVLTNTEFLTPQARKNMKATIAQKYQASRTQYDNIRKQSAAQINKITGGVDGEEYLIDYAESFPESTPAPAQAAPSGVPTYQQYLEQQRLRQQQGGQR